MLRRCRMCGKISLSWSKERLSCPKCGRAPSDGKQTEHKTRNVFSFPPRGNRSLGDKLDQQKQESLENKAIGESIILANWNDLLEKRPMDIPYFTALKARATILVFLSRQSIQQANIIETVLNSNLPLALQVEAFLKGTYPILRCNFVFPDNPRDPLILETPLDVTDGNVQDFCNAVVADETIDLILTHEHLGGRIFAVAVSAAGLAEVLKREVKSTLAALPRAATSEEFQRSIKVMEEVFPSGASGFFQNKSIALKVAGEARNKLIEY